uniref:Integrase catalytic domain-containing protein n=1 Tax=Oryza brachyantha TaxID=4533 RepID=J3MSC1_ORYBR
MGAAHGEGGKEDLRQGGEGRTEQGRGRGDVRSREVGGGDHTWKRGCFGHLNFCSLHDMGLKHMVEGGGPHRVFLSGVKIIKTNYEAFKCFKKIKAATKIELDMKLNAFHTDRGREFNSNEFTGYCVKLASIGTP